MPLALKPHAWLRSCLPMETGVRGLLLGTQTEQGLPNLVFVILEDPAKKQKPKQKTLKNKGKTKSKKACCRFILEKQTKESKKKHKTTLLSLVWGGQPRWKARPLGATSQGPSPQPGRGLKMLWLRVRCPGVAHVEPRLCSPRWGQRGLKHMGVHRGLQGAHKSWSAVAGTPCVSVTPGSDILGSGAQHADKHCYAWR